MSHRPLTNAPSAALKATSVAGSLTADASKQPNWFADSQAVGTIVDDE